MKQSYVIKSEEETTDFAKSVASLLRQGDVLALYGDLGAGKTFFTKQLCVFLGVQENVSSPSFVILNEYIGKFPIFHFDLYRLDSEDELLEIGIFDVLEDGITIIEWPEMATNLLPKHTYHIYFRIENDETRIIEMMNE